MYPIDNQIVKIYRIEYEDNRYNTEGTMSRYKVGFWLVSSMIEQDPGGGRRGVGADSGMKTLMDRMQTRLGKGENAVWLALAIALIVWASAFPGIRAGLDGYAPAHLALLRFLVACTVLTGYAVLRRIRLPEARDLPAICLAGFLGIAFYHVLLNTGELTVSAGAIPS